MRGRQSAFRVATSLALSLSPGCLLATVPVSDDAGAETEGRPNELPMESEAGSTESSSGTLGEDGSSGEETSTGDGDEDSCTSTEECPKAEFCWAEYGSGGGDAPDPEAFECHFECVVPNDPESMTDAAENYWCKDDASCCVPNSTCDDMGYCNSPAGDGDGDGDGDDAWPPPSPASHG